MIKVYAKATYAVGKPGDLNKPLHVIRANTIDGDVPDWAAEDLTFKGAVADGMIEILQTREDEIKAEHKAADQEAAAKPRKKKAADAV